MDIERKLDELHEEIQRAEHVKARHLMSAQRAHEVVIQKEKEYMDTLADARMNSKDFLGVELFTVKLSSAPYEGKYMTEGEMQEYRSKYEQMGALTEVYDAHTGNLHPDYIPF